MSTTRRPSHLLLRPLSTPERRCIGVPTFDGDNSWRLPVPARIVLAKGGTVLGIEADPDYTRRPEPEETLSVLRPRV